MTTTKTFFKVSCRLLLSFFLIFISTSNVQCGNNTSEKEVDDGLFLTKYIKSGNLTEGRRLSEVHLPDVDFNLTSYSGYFTVNETTNSTLFFWFFPAQTKQVENVPLLLWLQGGPGASLGVGLFVEHGPLKVIKDENGQPKVVLRNETWNREFAQLFIDSPVGTGFSFTSDESFYATTHQEVSRDLLEALKQFFTVFSEYRGNPFFITGQSYAGKFVASLGAAIHRLGGTREETTERWGINLQGFAIGNGLCDPASQLNYGDFLSATGLIDRKQRDWYREREVKMRKAIEKGDRAVFMEHLSRLWDAFEGHTGLRWQYNFLEQYSPKEMENWKYFYFDASTRASLHLGSHHRRNGFEVVRQRLQEKDVMAGVKAEVEELLEAGYRALFYAGNLDIIVAAPLVEGFVHSLNWTAGGGPGGRKFYDSERTIYRMDFNSSAVAGYVKEVGNLLYIVVRNAGHLVPYDQPKVALDMITRFVKGRSFTYCAELTDNC